MGHIVNPDPIVDGSTIAAAFYGADQLYWSARGRCRRPGLQVPDRRFDHLHLCRLVR